MKNLTIAILNYNSGEYLFKCLNSLIEVNDEASISTIVIDNNSTDESLIKVKEKFRNVKYIENKENLGFSKGYNPTLKEINSEYILLLNPDCLLKKGVIRKVLQNFESKKIGAVTCKILLPNGKIDLTAHRGFPTPVASFLYFLGNDVLYHLRKNISNELHEVDAIAGAFFMTTKSVMQEVGYLDEKFFLYGEDIDLCLRIKDKGYHILYDPTIEITHFKGISSGLKSHSQSLSAADIKTREKARDAFYEAMLIFYNKHYKNNYPFFINWLIYLGIFLKWNLAKLRTTV